ncbi:Ig-like domain-containing protein [Streptomyces sp. NPDC049099]|uniref:Ig-like domain-containing protein n=1 Tax=Streptomyces sp. NPDC049099 TaxID=3155768 RepID=UPI00343EE69D
MPATDTDLLNSMMAEITRLKSENDQLKKENEELKKKQDKTDPNGQHGGSHNGQVGQKEPVQLTASDTKGSVSGLASGTGRATLTDKNGKPVVGEKITFKVGETVVGTGITDANGTATVNSGSYLGDPVFWFKAVSTGYQAVYDGSEKYLPAQAHANVTPAFA